MVREPSRRGHMGGDRSARSFEGVCLPSSVDCPQGPRCRGRLHTGALRRARGVRPAGLTPPERAGTSSHPSRTSGWRHQVHSRLRPPHRQACADHRRRSSERGVARGARARLRCRTRRRGAQRRRTARIEVPGGRCGRPRDPRARARRRRVGASAAMTTSAIRSGCTADRSSWSPTPRRRCAAPRSGRGPWRGWPWSTPGLALVKVPPTSAAEVRAWFDDRVPMVLPAETVEQLDQWERELRGDAPPSSPGWRPFTFNALHRQQRGGRAYPYQMPGSIGPAKAPLMISKRKYVEAKRRCADEGRPLGYGASNSHPFLPSNPRARWGTTLVVEVRDLVS